MRASCLPFCAAILIVFLSMNGCQHGPTGGPRVTDREPFTRQIQVPRSIHLVEVRHFDGSVTVQGWDQDYILLEGYASATAKDAHSVRTLLSQIQHIAYEIPSERLVIEYEDPLSLSRYNPFDISDFNVHVTVSLPRNLQLELSNRNGPVAVKDIRSGILVRQRRGNVEVENIAAGAQILATDSNVSARQVHNFLELDVRRGDVDIRNIGGDLTVHQHESGRFLAENITGDVYIDARRSVIALNYVQGKLWINNRGGNVTCRAFRRGIEASVFGGSLMLTPGGAVAGNYLCEVDGGDLTVRVADNSSMLIEIEAENGAIESDFPMPVSADRNRSYVKGAVLSGQYRMQLKVRRGKASLLKSAETFAPPPPVTMGAGSSVSERPASATPAASTSATPATPSAYPAAPSATTPPSASETIQGVEL